MHLLVYVDNMMITGSGSKLIDDLKNILKMNFQIKDLARSNEGIVLNQRKCTLNYCLMQVC